MTYDVETVLKFLRYTTIEENIEGVDED